MKYSLGFVANKNHLQIKKLFFKRGENYQSVLVYSIILFKLFLCFYFYRGSYRTNLPFALLVWNGGL